MLGECACRYLAVMPFVAPSPLMDLSIGFVLTAGVLNSNSADRKNLRSDCLGVFGGFKCFICFSRGSEALETPLRAGYRQWWLRWAPGYAPPSPYTGVS